MWSAGTRSRSREREGKRRGRAEVIRPFERPDALDCVPGPVEFGAAAAASPARSPTTQPRSRAQRRSRTRDLTEASSATASPVDGHDEVPQDGRRQPPDRQLLDRPPKRARRPARAPRQVPGGGHRGNPLFATSATPGPGSATGGVNFPADRANEGGRLRAPVSRQRRADARSLHPRICTSRDRRTRGPVRRARGGPRWWRISGADRCRGGDVLRSRRAASAITDRISQRPYAPTPTGPQDQR